MGRTTGSTNAQVAVPETYLLSLEQRTEMISQLLIEIISDELSTND